MKPGIGTATGSSPAPANQDSHVELDIVICTCGDQHLLEQLQLPPGTYEHQRFDCDPMYLGFECHDVLRERLGDYDLFGYMEDDLILHDPAFFTKIAWFHGHADEHKVLQPNRYERYISPTQLKKVYIDFEFAPEEEIIAKPDELHRCRGAGPRHRTATHNQSTFRLFLPQSATDGALDRAGSLRET